MAKCYQAANKKDISRDIWESPMVEGSKENHSSFCRLDGDPPRVKSVV